MDQCLGIPELLDHIAQYLNARPLAACTAVSHSWRVLWTRLLYRSPHVEAAAQLVQYGHLARKLRWRPVAAQSLDLARIHCQHLQNIQIDNAQIHSMDWRSFWAHVLGLQPQEDAFPMQLGRPPPTADMVHQWQRQLLQTSLSLARNGFLSATVQSLHLQCAGSSDVLETLIYGRLAALHRIQGAELDGHECILPSLRHLSLEETYHETSRSVLSLRAFSALLMAFPSLETLSIPSVRLSGSASTFRGHRNIDLDADIDSTMSLLTRGRLVDTTNIRLQTLTVSLHDPELSVLFQLIDWTPNLQSLTLRTSPILSEAARIFVRHCPQLKTLILRSGNRHHQPSMSQTHTWNVQSLDTIRDDEEGRGLESLLTLRFHWMVISDAELDYLTRNARQLRELALLYKRPLPGSAPPMPTSEFRPSWRAIHRAISVNCRWLTTLKIRFATSLPVDFFRLEEADAAVQTENDDMTELVDTTTLLRFRQVREWPCAKTLESVHLTDVFFRKADDSRIFRQNFCTWTNLKILTIMGKGICPEAFVQDRFHAVVFPNLSCLHVQLEADRPLVVDHARALVETMPVLEDLDLTHGLSAEAERWLAECRPTIMTF